MPVLILAALGGYLLLTLTADLLNPDWNPVETMVSHYVHARAGWLIPAALLCLAAASALLTRLIRAHAPRTTVVLLRIWTLAVLAGAIFPADPYGRWDRPPSIAGLLHGLAALTAFTVLPAAALTLRPRTAALTVAPYLLLLVAFYDVQDGPTLTFGGHESLIGAAERLTLWTYVAWLAGTALSHRRPGPGPDGTPGHRTARRRRGEQAPTARGSAATG
ncbi:hypothetical protein Q0Z83_031110 [Actinoplanes sichuanensis]|uniref:DUF998 domain-containing protein n=1 Tax=Actinoplanes sichuanensis TaxID=512349 RepID=A0ABW4AQN3_9ACTN|nr:DUF998 domain-containing protein [Actinoplanes sichuanensis]BEL04920.1 hypothetical protein Q0Z83_031110 [Actinoplanes sichuanensis]